jgi:hypothetical protein
MGKENLYSIVDKVRADTSAIRKIKKERNNPSAWRKIWDDTMRKYFPECRVTYSDFTSRRLRLAIENRGLPFEDVPHLIPWTIKQWDFIRHHVFSLNPKTPYGPESPDMDTVLHFLDKIYPVYFRERNALTFVRPTVSADALPPTAVPPQPVQKLVPRPISAPPRPKLPEYDHTKTEATRVKLNLPKWD